MSRPAWLVCLLFIHLAPALGQSARSLTVQIWSAHDVKSLRALRLGQASGPVQIDWAATGLHVTSPERTIKQLSLSGTYRLEADAAPVTAAGQWTIAWQSSGIRVLLTLPSERYVAAALNAEAAPDEPLASLKALAITIRTFALANAGRHRAQGFDFCDSTHCQALHFIQTRPEVRRAVQETAGETLWFGKQLAHVYYTQHCGGSSAAAADVWPHERAPYLSAAHADPYCLRRSAAAWNVSIPLGELSRIFKAEGWRTPSPITAIEVDRRYPGGRAEQLTITGQGPRATISASSFRFAVDRTLGWNQIRSDWYSARVAAGALALTGHGYGHGVGLCQAGAFEMAREEHSDGDILDFYFPRTVRGVAAAGVGWQRTNGAGWTLLTAGPPGPLPALGNAALLKAQALLGEKSATNDILVQELPSTELFRQTSNEPGWMLASTQGRLVLLQPPAVREKNGGTDSLLLHEFLHVLVEQRVSAHAPLWLREGLVETLAAPDARVPVDLSVDEVESALAHPADATSSRHAHLVAAAMTQRLCDRYGLKAVKGFLHDGVPLDYEHPADPRGQKASVVPHISQKHAR